MVSLRTAGSIGLASTILITVACGDSSESLNPTAPSAVVAATVSDQAGASNAESGATGRSDTPEKPEEPGKPEEPEGPNGRDDDDRGPSTPAPTPSPAPPTNTSPGSPSVPTNPVTGKIELEGQITAINGTSITVNGRAVLVPVDAVIRRGSRAVAFSELRVGDRVHVRASMQGTTLEASEVKLQHPDDDDGDDDEDGGGSVRVTLLDCDQSAGAMRCQGAAPYAAFFIARSCAAVRNIPMAV